MKLDEQLKKEWKEIRYVHVKGHVGVTPNELCDEKAKGEVDRCRDGNLEEVVLKFGEIKDQGMLIETREQLKKQRKWGKEWEMEIMKETKSHMAKRIQIGAERWQGNELPMFWGKKKKCRWCAKTHGANFFEMVLECDEIEEFRKEVRSKWALVKGMDFCKELFFGRVKKQWWEKVVKRLRGSGKLEAAKKNILWWEKRVRQLRKELERKGKEMDSEETDDESSVDEEREEDSDGEEEEKIKRKVKEKAESVRVFDEGVVKKGEPDLVKCSSRGDLKKTLMGRKKK